MKIIFNKQESRDMDNNILLHVKIVSEQEDNELLTTRLLHGNTNQFTVCKDLNELINKYQNGDVMNSGDKNITGMTDEQIKEYTKKMIKLLENLVAEFDEKAGKIRKMRNRIFKSSYNWVL